MYVVLSLNIYHYLLYCFGSVCSVTVLIVAYGKHQFFLSRDLFNVQSPELCIEIDATYTLKSLILR